MASARITIDDTLFAVQSIGNAVDVSCFHGESGFPSSSPQSPLRVQWAVAVLQKYQVDPLMRCAPLLPASKTTTSSKLVTEPSFDRLCF